MTPGLCIKTVLFGREPISVRRLVALLVVMGLCGLAWLALMGVVDPLLPHRVATTVGFGVPLLVLILTGVMSVYDDHGIVIGWLAGTSFFLGFMYLFQDYSLTWHEILVARVVLSAGLAAAGVAVGGPIGFVLRRVRSPADG